ncbi:MULTISPECIES: helix-turn-helix transcriptional regulator [unclassified Streptomyces]|uniref:helix-turn-helix domain-containing protein n=1 Tax=unclassified Streptomyces TaxID=2593676 RepID=UPI002251A155|nr:MULTISPECIES: helix-turn-helix transcriptional regulator [unclassified Streptomyces]MCX4989989.1 helix-turn-helix domain-containing protein [Streptomyces sp. NBC_00568]MCX5004781.1 helix-turn-helix domain-containing protein [Streptomyces sp. NBC_00638]
MRNNPTGRQLRLGTELRKLRERAGLTSTQAGKLLGVRQNQISNVEAGRAGVSPERVRALACHYDSADRTLVEALSSMAAERIRGWWEEYREILPGGLIDLAEMEHHATRLSAGVTAHVPGLLQIHDHAREVFRQVVPELSPPDVEHRLSFRIKRQAVLFKDSPTPYRAVIHEAALRMQFGGPAVATKQLRHILDMSERAHITVQVIPFAAGAYPGSGQSILYAHGAVPQLDTVHLDQSHGSALLDAEAQLDKYRVLLERMTGLALGPHESREFIHAIAQDL